MAMSIPDGIQVGETISVTVTGSSHGGETVYVQLTSDDGGQTGQIEVQLDEDGNGTGTWTVQAWSEVKFNYSTCAEQVRYPAVVAV